MHHACIYMIYQSTSSPFYVVLWSTKIFRSWDLSIADEWNCSVNCAIWTTKTLLYPKFPEQYANVMIVRITRCHIILCSTQILRRFKNLTDTDRQTDNETVLFQNCNNKVSVWRSFFINLTQNMISMFVSIENEKEPVGSDLALTVNTSCWSFRK